MRIIKITPIKVPIMTSLRFIAYCLLPIAYCLLSSSNSFAHPGIGIVCDSHGNIFYTDLKNIYKISPDGKKSIAVEHVHSHELYLDEDDNLFGEHLWYNGEKLNTWGYYVWCLKSDGKLVKIKEPTEGFRSDYSFLQDSLGNMYWIERFTVSRFKKKTTDGTITTVAEGKFRDIRWSYCTKKGIFYFLDLDKLYKLTPDGRFILLAEKLNETTPAFGFIGERHNAYGIWTDNKENIYVALHGGQRVKRISPGGKIETVYYSAAPWSPTSGVFDKQGNLWLLEYTITASCRVIKVAGTKILPIQPTAGNYLLNNVLPLIIITLILLFCFLLLRKVFRSIRVVRNKVGKL